MSFSIPLIWRADRPFAIPAPCRAVVRERAAEWLIAGEERRGPERAPAPSLPPEPLPLRHEVELLDGEQEKPVIVKYRHGQLCRAREVAHGIFHIAVGLGLEPGRKFPLPPGLPF